MIQNNTRQLTTTAAPAARHAMGMFHAARPAIDKMKKAVDTTVRKQPLVVVVVGLAIGVAAGCLIKRR